jgi:hypothetical protein
MLLGSALLSQAPTHVEVELDCDNCHSLNSTSNQVSWITTHPPHLNF